MFSFALPEGERALMISKAHWSSYLSVWLKVVATAIILVLILTFSWENWWNSHVGKAGVAFFLILAFGYVIFDFWNRFLTSYIITQCRLIDITQERFFRRTITEIDINEVEEIIYKQRSLWDKIFKKGDLIIKLKEEKGVLVFYDVLEGEKAREVIEEINKETSTIFKKEAKGCDVILKDNKEHKVPLSYQYYGDKAKGKSSKNGLLVVKKK